MAQAGVIVKGPDGSFVPPKQQDASRWSRTMIFEADAQLATAVRAGVFGRQQCAAAIRSVHAQRR